MPMYNLLSPYVFILWGIVVLLLILTAVLHYVKKQREDNYLPYEKRLSVMTEAEKKYFLQLQQQYGNEYYIFPQINLDKLVNVTDKNDYYRYFNKINRKSVDFVLVDKMTLNTIQVIELDDWTHQKQSRKKRDIFVGEIFKKIEVPINSVK